LEVSLLRLLAIFVHYIANDAEVDGKLFAATFLSFLLGLLNEGVPLGVSVREEDHHDPQDDSLLLVDLEFSVLGQDVLTEEVVDEVLHNLIHLVLREGLDGSILHVLVPGSWLINLHFGESILEEHIELVFIKLSHGSEARSLEEKVKVLVVFGLLCTIFFSLLR